jgi:flagellar biosynthesis protein FlhB
MLIYFKGLDLMHSISKETFPILDIELYIIILLVIIFFVIERKQIDKCIDTSNTKVISAIGKIHKIINVCLVISIHTIFWVSMILKIDLKIIFLVSGSVGIIRQLLFSKIIYNDHYLCFKNKKIVFDGIKGFKQDASYAIKFETHKECFYLDCGNRRAANEIVKILKDKSNITTELEFESI